MVERRCCHNGAYRLELVNAPLDLINFAHSCLITTAALVGHGVTIGSKSAGSKPVRYHREGTTCATVAGFSPATLNCPGVAGRDGPHESPGRYADIGINLIMPTSELCRAAFAHRVNQPPTLKKIWA